MTNKAATATTKASCPQCGAEVLLPEYADGLVCASCGSTLARAQLHVTSRGREEQPEEQALRSVQCSQCAGPLNAREGRRILVCGHCGVRVVVKEHGGFSRWHFPLRVDRLRAAAAGAKWLSEYPGIAKQAREASFVEAHLVYVPIWEHRALVAGWEFGRKLRTRINVSPYVLGSISEQAMQTNLEVFGEPVQEPRLQERRFFQTAADFGALGATRPAITGRELVLPLLAGELDPAGTVLEAAGDAAEVTEQGRRAAVQPLSGAASPDCHLFAFRESTTLLYYPLWLLGYRQGNRTYRVVVNGRTGDVNAARAPAAKGAHFARLAAQIVAVAVVVGLLVWLWAAHTAWWGVALRALVIVSVIVALSTWHFRAEKEVVYHEPFSS